MSAIIVIEIVVGIVILAGAVRFAVRDTRQRSDSGPEQDGHIADTAEVPASPEPQPAQQLSEVGAPETN
ncbi:MAG: hypothetical protein ACRDS0_29845 [Pseudonocardiaceae bacterium]